MFIFSFLTVAGQLSMFSLSSDWKARLAC